MRILLLLNFAFSCLCFQVSAQLKNWRSPANVGTLVIAAVASDGILITADSRMTYVESTSSGLLEAKYYKDSVQKVFSVKGIPIAIAGVSTFGTKSFSDVVSDYNKYGYGVDPINVFTINEDFLFYIAAHYPLNQYPQLSRSSFLSGGYRNDSAFVTLIRYREGGLHWRTEGVFFSDSAVQSIYLKYIPYGKLHPADFLRKQLGKIFLEYNKSRKTTGGPISILKINKNNSFVWLKNGFFDLPHEKIKQKNIPKNEATVWNKEVNQHYNNIP